jgi:hypothetical protein
MFVEGYSFCDLTQPAVTRAVQRGEKLAAENEWWLEKLVNA